jgi:CHRD domain
MKTLTTRTVLAMAGLFTLSATSAMADDDYFKVKAANLSGFQQAPSIISNGSGNFIAKVYQDRMEYKLTYQNLSSKLNEAHIHFAQPGVNGEVMVAFCGDRNNPCTTGKSGTLQGTVNFNQIKSIPKQFLKAGDFNQFVRAIKSGATYVNLHSTLIDGEVRGQIVLGNW